MFRALGLGGAFFLFLCLGAEAGGKKGPKFQASFHIQADETDGRAFVLRAQTLGQEVFYKRSPDFTLDDVIAFSPFPAKDGFSFGVVFQLKKAAAQRLFNATTANQGRYFLAVVNGQPRDAVYIDAPVRDGVLVVWQDIVNPEIQMLNEKFPRMGEDPKEWKKRKKKEKKFKNK